MTKNLQVCSNCGTGSWSEVWNLSFAYSATFMTSLHRRSELVSAMQQQHLKDQTSCQPRRNHLPIIIRTPRSIPIAWPVLGFECSRSTCIKHEFSLEHVQMLTAKRSAMKLMRSLTVQFDHSYTLLLSWNNSSEHSIPSSATSLSNCGTPLSLIIIGAVYTFSSKLVCFGER